MLQNRLKPLGSKHMTLGHRIRKFREEKGLTLRKLAIIADISSSLMSQIENNKVDPSLSTLRKIAQALDIPVFYLVMEESSNHSMLVKKNKRKRVVFPKGDLRYEILHSDYQKKMGVMIGTLSRGGFTSEVRLSHDGEECLVIIDGILKVELPHETLQMEKGDSLYFDSSIPHRLYNDQKKDCQFYLIITPPKF